MRIYNISTLLFDVDNIICQLKYNLIFLPKRSGLPRGPFEKEDEGEDDKAEATCSRTSGGRKRREDMMPVFNNPFLSLKALKCQASGTEQKTHTESNVSL